MRINYGDEEEQNELLNSFLGKSNFNLNLNLQIDSENNNGYLQAKLKDDDEQLLKINCGLVDEKMYLESEELYDKTIKFDTDDEEEKIFSTDSIEELKEIDYTKLNGIISSTIYSKFESENITKEKVNYTVNDVTNKYTKYAISINYIQLKQKIKNILEELYNNQEFWNCFNNSELKDELEDELKNYIDTYSEEDDFEYDIQIEISMYTTGFFKPLVKVVEINSDDKSDESKYGIRLIDNEDSSYKIENYDDEKEVNSFTLRQNGNTFEIRIKSDSIPGKEIIITSTNKYNTNIEKCIQTENAVDYEELDYMQLLENLESTKLYEKYIKEYYQNMYEDYGADYEDYEDYEDFFELGDYEYYGDVETYSDELSNGEIKVKYSVPYDFEAEGENTEEASFKYYKNDNNDTIKVMINSMTSEQYEERINSKFERYSFDVNYISLQMNSGSEYLDDLEYTKYDIIYEVESNDTTKEIDEAFYYVKIDENHGFVIEIENEKNLLEYDGTEFLKDFEIQ